MPTTVCPSEATDSFGGYVASAATTIAPFDLTAAGTCAAAEVFVGALLAAVPVVLEELPVLPQPPRTTAALARPATAATNRRLLGTTMGHLPKRVSREHTPTGALRRSFRPSGV